MLSSLESVMSSSAASSVSPFRACGAWRLHPGQAMSLHPREASLLRIHRGPVWVTLGEPGALSPQASGDRFLKDGESMVVPPGARLVMEPLSARESDGPVCFDWTGAAPVQDSRFGREVRAPLHEAVTAFGQAAWALLRVARGLLGYSEFLVAGRGRVLSPLECLR
jgi:Protein of unknown function (DUF2917)